MHVSSELIRAQLENRTTDPTNPQTGMAYYNTNLGKFKLYNATSAKWDIFAPQIAYIENGDAESTLNGWATYQDAAAANPVDGTGGTAVSTLIRSAVAPLRGGASFLLTKDAADRQGEGTSYDFLIATADQGQVLSLKFDYETGGAFTTGGSSDVQMFLYDVTNATLIPIFTSSIDAASGRFDATFTAAANSVSYRLIFHIATVNAAAWTMKYDKVDVSPNLSVANTVFPIPCGTIFDFAGVGEPAGYLFCDGSAVSRTAYAALFATLGEIYGPGNGTTTFELPDLRGRAAIGKDDMGNDAPPGAGLVYHNNMNDLNVNPEIGVGVITLVGTAAVGSGALVVPVGAGNYGTIPAVSVGIGDIGTWRGVNIPQYTGSPTDNLPVFLVVDNGAVTTVSGSNQGISFVHETSGQLSIEFYANAVQILPLTAIGAYAPTSGVPDEIEVNWDLATNQIHIYLNGIRIYTNTSLPPGSFAAWSGTAVVAFQNSGWDSGTANTTSTFDSLSYFNQMQHTTASYTPGTVVFTPNDSGRVTTAESGIDGDALGAVGGVEAYALTGLETGVHTHGVNFTSGNNQQNHTHELNGWDANGVNTTVGPNENILTPNNNFTTSIESTPHTHNIGGTTDNGGAGDTHQNMPPTLILNKIIKT